MNYPHSDDPNAQRPADPPGYTLPPTSGGEYPPDAAPAGDASSSQVEYPVIPMPQEQPYQPQVPSLSPYNGSPAPPPFQVPASQYYPPSPYQSQQSGPPYQQSAPPFHGQQSGPPYQQSGAPFQGQQSAPPYQVAAPQQFPPHQFQGQPQPAGPWQPPTFDGKAAGSGGMRPLHWIIIGIAALVVLALVATFVLLASKGGDDRKSPRVATSSHARSSNQPKTPADTANPGKPGGTYAMVDKVCEKIDLTPLGTWSAKQEGSSKRDSNVGGRTMSSCSFDLRSSSGVKVDLDIEIQIFSTASDAESDYDFSLDFDKSKYYDTTIPDLGDEAYGNSRDWDLGLKVSTYEVIFRSGNLILSTEVATYATSYAPKADIKDKALTEARSVLSLLNKG